MQDFNLVYSSGTVTESHGIPFSFFRRRNLMRRTKLVKRKEARMKVGVIKTNSKKQLDYQIYNSNVYTTYSL
jgi:hypothetical protein